MLQPKEEKKSIEQIPVQDVKIIRQYILQLYDEEMATLKKIAAL